VRHRRGQSEAVNGQKKTDIRTSKDIQNTAQKNKDSATRTPLKNGCELRCSGRVSSCCSTSGTRRVNLVPQYLLLGTNNSSFHFYLAKQRIAAMDNSGFWLAKTLRIFTFDE